ncbi:hypothetical protein EHO98_08020 [Leptospira stimsonii]|uniref:Uncharacterized protein n=1 Tax=Leptospira stimsonii TaxID=2202203 RepID=A0ABY2MWZ1_9LEPT|nr:hypothetical protein EHO98_08020 [Leptospira stimsonii]TGM10674.1 hypothetical protein EHQ90_18020 [Leptospira stimsonii]
MRRKEYSKSLLLIKCLFNSPLKRPTSPSKTATSPGGRLGVACPSPGGRRPPSFAFCWGLEGVSKQNRHFTSRKSLLGSKILPVLVPVLAVAGFERYKR